MAISVRGTTDEIIDGIVKELERYQEDHPDAEVVIYRQNPVSVRVRIVDPDFVGQSKLERSDTVWEYLDQLDEEVQGDISTLLLLTPEELGKSFANFEFEHPSPSML